MNTNIDVETLAQRNDQIQTFRQPYPGVQHSCADSNNQEIKLVVVNESDCAVMRRADSYPLMLIQG